MSVYTNDVAHLFPLISEEGIGVIATGQEIVPTPLSGVAGPVRSSRDVPPLRDYFRTLLRGED